MSRYCRIVFDYSILEYVLEEQLKYMYGLERFGIKLGLTVMEALLAELGHPQQQFKSIHITGTNGKGSVAAMLESILRTGGRRTALYTSPHLFTFNERIRVNNIPISDPELGHLITQVKNAAEKAHVTPTFFEFTTAIAFCYFAQKKPDVAVIEVGMGGLLDATNVIIPLVSVITNIGLDHTPLLGTTRQEIALNKAGIIKPGVPAVTAEHDRKIRHLLADKAKQKKSTLRYTGDEIELVPLRQTRHDQTFRRAGQEYTVPLLGKHQLDNAAIALLVLDELEKGGIRIDRDAVVRGFAATRWSGRLEVVSEQPFILVDGAHNPQSLLALHGFLTDPATKPTSYDVLVVGMKSDKDISVLRDTVAPLFSHIIATEGSYEPMPAEQLAVALKRRGGRIKAMANPTEATAQGLELIGEEGSMVITGSLYMIPEALTFLREKLPTRTAESLRAAL